MKLKKFVSKYVESNTIIRLWYPILGGHEQVNDDLYMEWNLIKGEFANNIVKGVKDIVVLNTPYPEAVNIVIERK
jgi:hypothetical protein